MSLNNFTQDIFLKRKCLFADVISVKSSDRAEHGISGVVLGIFWPIQVIFVAGEPLCDVGTHS